jgi:hypothetical protein
MSMRINTSVKVPTAIEYLVSKGAFEVQLISQDGFPATDRAEKAVLVGTAIFRNTWQGPEFVFIPVEGQCQSPGFLIPYEHSGIEAMFDEATGKPVYRIVSEDERRVYLLEVRS